ncbi:TPA: hypothetical protein NKX27_003337 [Vibrio parahaemolyticus]|nr:hypothetical protein [Vibrio parahaemolyticus]
MMTESTKEKLCPVCMSNFTSEDACSDCSENFGNCFIGSKTRSIYDWIDNAVGCLGVVFICVVVYFFLSEIWESFEISPEEYQGYSVYLEHEFCGQMAFDYASDGRVTVFELSEVRDCTKQDEKRDFYSKLEANK